MHPVGRTIRAALTGAWLGCALSLSWALPAAAQAGEAREVPVIRERTEALPKRLENIDVKERLGQPLPLDLVFTDEQGKSVKLGDSFRGDLPVIITLNYSDCPMLCSLQLNGFTDGLKALDWHVGEQFRVVTVSLDPKETPERALKSKRRYLKQYARTEASVEPGWVFLTGKEENIQALARTIGFSYAYNEKRQEYVHPAAITIASPDGMIARYLYGIEYAKDTLRLALVEASEGKVGTTIDRLILYCFHYDSSEGRYAPVARNIMKLGGAAALLIFGGFLSAMWRFERSRKLRAA